MLILHCLVTGLCRNFGSDDVLASGSARMWTVLHTDRALMVEVHDYQILLNMTCCVLAIFLNCLVWNLPLRRCQPECLPLLPRFFDRFGLRPVSCVD